jgi:hypothetical protein
MTSRLHLAVLSALLILHDPSAIGQEEKPEQRVTALIEQLSGSEEERTAARKALLELGPDYAATAPLLIEAMMIAGWDGPDSRSRAAEGAAGQTGASSRGDRLRFHGDR